MDDGRLARYVIAPNRRIFAIALMMAGVVMLATSLVGQWLVGVLFVVGLFVGVVHATMSANAIKRFVDRDEDNKRAFALLSLLRLGYITAIVVVLVLAFHRAAIGAIAGLVVFHFLVVISRTAPALRELRKG